jgi:hypothetical protein
VHTTADFGEGGRAKRGRVGFSYKRF